MRARNNEALCGVCMRANIFHHIVTLSLGDRTQLAYEALPAILQPAFSSRHFMSDTTPEANTALVLAHYAAVTNGHHPDAIRAQLAPTFYDHGAAKKMSADEVIAHSAAMHATFGNLSAVAECLVAE